MKKIFIILIILIVLIIVTLTFYLKSSSDENLNRKLLQEIKYKDNIFVIYDQEAPTSFNSNNKILSLQDSEGKIIEEKRYGAHPLIIESVDDNSIHLLIPITFYERDNIDYINSWAKKNKTIEKYNIEYKIFDDNATSTDDFKYPHN